ncbi:hypothetical protein N0V90_008710 [Kalmusia sp. IMI 367209]|nr:hypothetical protein N0V90_008710 [Kalmusia sp. IMI 367209]
MRKNRMCFGYRNEQDMVFRNETGLVIRKVKRRATEDEETASPSDEDTFAQLDLSALVQHPSRRATLQDEAIMHWLANFNERFFSSSPDLEAGFEYVLPVYRTDLVRGGPAVEIINACGLAALGNSKNSPDLLRAARVKQVKVLRQLNEQLQDPEQALSDSSVLTCLLLSSFENIMCEGSQSMAASTTHLRGAATLVKMRGQSQFNGLVGHGMFVRLRGSMLALCLLTSEPLPEYFLTHMEEERLSETDFEVIFFKLINRVCSLRARHKHSGFVDAEMVEEAKSVLEGYQDWDPDYPDWVVPPSQRREHRKPKGAMMLTKGADKAHRFVWVSMSWLLNQTAQILVYEILIVYYRAQEAIAPNPETSHALQDAMASQLRISEAVREAVEYYLQNFETSQATTRSIGAHMLMMPLSILLGTSTASTDTFMWIAKMASRISDVFALKQGKMVADFLLMGIKAETFALSPTSTPLSYTSTILSSAEGSPEDQSLPSSEPSPASKSGPDILIS